MDKAFSACTYKLGNRFYVTGGYYFFRRKENCVWFSDVLCRFPREFSGDKTFRDRTRTTELIRCEVSEP